MSSTTDLSELVDRLRSRYDDACFVCGRDNPMGLCIDGFRTDGGDLVAAFEPRPEYRGTPDVLHGGIAAAALDEMMVWAGIIEYGVMSVTGSLRIRYRNPAPVGGLFEVRGRVDERRGRRLVASGELLLDGAVTADAQALLLVTDTVDELLAS